MEKWTPVSYLDMYLSDVRKESMVLIDLGNILGLEGTVGISSSTLKRKESRQVRIGHVEARRESCIA